MANKNLWRLHSDKKIHLVFNNEQTLCGESIVAGAEKPPPHQNKITCSKCSKAVRAAMVYSITQIN